MCTSNLASVLVLGDKGSVNPEAGAQKVLDNKVGVNLGRAEAEDNVRKDSNADKAGKTATESTDNVDVVVAAHGVVRNAVELALSEAEQASSGGELGKDAGGQRSLDVSSDDGVAESVGVEDDDGLGEFLNVESSETGRGAAEDGADGGGQGDVEVDVQVDAESEGGDFGLNVDLSAEGEGVESDLAPSVGSIVLGELGGRDGAEGRQSNLGTSGIALRRWPSARQSSAAARLAGGVVAHAGSALAGLDPGAVGHSLGAVEAAGEGDSGADVGRGLGDDLVAELEVGCGGNAGADGDAGSSGHRGQGGDGSEETHFEY